MEYTIVSSPSGAGLEVRVTKHIQKGWVPQGGVAHSVQAENGEYYFVQAMIKK